MYSNSSSQEQKLAYEPIVEKSSIVLHFKVFGNNKELRLAMLHHIYMKKMG